MFAEKFLYITIMSLFCLSHAFGQDTKTTAGEKFEHVTVLHDMPADQMGKVMNIMSAALGVNCTHCHVGYDFAKEDNENKTTARKMITMTLGLNRDHFGDKSVVTCMTCHQGSAIPVNAMLSATQIATVKSIATSTSVPIKATDAAARDVRKQSAQETLKRYQAFRRTDVQSNTFVSQRWNAIRKEPTGKQEREIVSLLDRTSWEQVTYYDQVAVTERFNNGVIEKLSGNKTIDLKPDEMAHIKIEASLALELDLDSLFSNWIAAEPVMIAERPMQVLRATDGELTHHFYFDNETGHLRRRTASLPTVLGAYVVEVDYEDYQLINAVNVPLRTIFKMPSVTWERHIQR